MYNNDINDNDNPNIYYRSYKHENNSKINNQNIDNTNYEELKKELLEERKKNQKLMEQLNSEKDKVKELKDVENQIIAINFISVD